MANQLKKKAEPALPKPEELKPEKEPTVTLQEIAKDDRTRKILGAVSLLICLFLFFSFSSYLFTWQQDQDKVQQFGVKIFSTTDVTAANLLGVLGAYTAYNFMNFGFGVASYLFCTFFFVAGINLLYGKKVFSVLRNVKYMLVGLSVLSVALSFFTVGSTFSWGGATGELIELWLVKWIGYVGTGALLSFAVFIYFIWRFNPSFRWPERKKMPVAAKIKNESSPATEFPETATPVFAESPVATHNVLKGTRGISVTMPEPPVEENELHRFQLREILPATAEETLPDEEELQQETSPPVTEPKLIINDRNAYKNTAAVHGGFGR